MASLLFTCTLLLFLIVYAASQSQRPNFIFILTDDESYYLGDENVTPNTINLIGKQGVTFTNAMISTPICCPSRTETISGRNFQNIRNGNNNCMHIDASYNIWNNTNSWFQLFSASGYLTGSFGKLTNENPWCKSNPPLHGFSRINIPCSMGNFYDTKWFDLYTNGSHGVHNITNGVAQPESYQTSVLGNASIEWFKEITKNYPNKPFIAWIGPHAPHCPATPASWYANEFNDRYAPRTPNFNKKAYNHHDYVSTNPVLNNESIWWIDQLYRDRLRTLLSVDDMVKGIIDTLSSLNILDNTYILFSSDHGFKFGQWRIPFQKHHPYETDIRIPLYLTGPSVKKGSINSRLVGNIDILPTFLELAGIKYDKNTYDGRSMVDVINDNKTEDWRDIYLSQYASTGTHDLSQAAMWFPGENGSLIPGKIEHAIGTNEYGQAWMIDVQETGSWRALRIMNDSYNMLYAEFVLWPWIDGYFNNSYFYELYNIQDDPYQMDNLYDALSGDMKNEYHNLMIHYANCSGTNCW
eukprot:427889_1